MLYVLIVKEELEVWQDAAQGQLQYLSALYCLFTIVLDALYDNMRRVSLYAHLANVLFYCPLFSAFIMTTKCKHNTFFNSPAVKTCCTQTALSKKNDLPITF